jgi:5-methyltetrahydropteroyltriglutamate--homocysteine methyltransferase
VVQIDEPYMQAQPDKARQFGLKALNRALENVSGETAVHICFGYAVYLKNKPAGYSFLSELAACTCKQVSIETAQPRLDCSVLGALNNKRIMVGCIDLSTPEVESPEVVADRVRKALNYVKPENVILAPDCGMKFLPADAAFGKLRAMTEAARILRREYA